MLEEGRWAEELFLPLRQLHHQFVARMLGRGIFLPSNFTILLPCAGHRHCSSQPASAPGRIRPHGSPSFYLGFLFPGYSEGNNVAAQPALTRVLLLLIPRSGSAKVLPPNPRCWLLFPRPWRLREPPRSAGSSRPVPSPQAGSRGCVPGDSQ